MFDDKKKRTCQPPNCMQNGVIIVNTEHNNIDHIKILLAPQRCAN